MMWEAEEARIPAAINACCADLRKTTIVVASSEKTAGIRNKRTRRKIPKPSERSIFIPECS